MTYCRYMQRNLCVYMYLCMYLGMYIPSPSVSTSIQFKRSLYSRFTNSSVLFRAYITSNLNALPCLLFSPFYTAVRFNVNGRPVGCQWFTNYLFMCCLLSLNQRPPVQPKIPERVQLNVFFSTYDSLQYFRLSKLFAIQSPRSTPFRATSLLILY